MVRNIKVGSLVIETADGSSVSYDGPINGTRATLIVRDDSFYKKVIFSGEIAFGEA